MLKSVVVGESFSAGLTLEFITTEDPQRKHFCRGVSVLVFSPAVWAVDFVSCFVPRLLSTLLMVYLVAFTALTHLFYDDEAN